MPANRPRQRASGRKLTITDPARRERLLELIRAGVPLGGAAVNVGMAPRSLFRTLERGRNAQARQEDGEPVTDPGDRACLDFFMDVAQARSAVMVEHVDVVRRAALGGYVVRRTTRSFRGPDGKIVEEVQEDLAPLEWKAAQWFLAQSFKNDFRTGQQDDPVMGAAPGDDPTGVEGPRSPQALESVAARLVAVRAEREADGDVVVAEVVDDDR